MILKFFFKTLPKFIWSLFRDAILPNIYSTVVLIMLWMVILGKHKPITNEQIMLFIFFCTLSIREYITNSKEE